MTDEQIAQRNRENASHSSGPRTSKGKRRSSLNAHRTGLTGQIVCLTPEELAVYSKFCEEIISELAPVGAIEKFYAKSVADNMFRSERARAIENGMFANGHRSHVDEIESGHPEVDTALAASKTFQEQASAFELVTTYEGRISRNLERHRAELKILQAERKASHETAAVQATEFMELAEAMGETYEPGEDFVPAAKWGGFVFSEDDICRRRERQAHVRAARKFSIRGELPPRRPKPDDEVQLQVA